MKIKIVRPTRAEIEKEYELVDGALCSHKSDIKVRFNLLKWSNEYYFEYKHNYDIYSEDKRQVKKLNDLAESWNATIEYLRK